MIGRMDFDKSFPYQIEHQNLITALHSALKAVHQCEEDEWAHLAAIHLNELHIQMRDGPLDLACINKVSLELEKLDTPAFNSLIVVSRILLARFADYLPDFAVFRDFADTPEMVIIPSGNFLMGSPEDEHWRNDDEGPQHQVIIPQRLAIGRYPVTFEEWETYAEDELDDCYRPDDMGWGRGRRPAINVSWEDAQAYLRWLRNKTGRAYRLPSEAEWEYCCRAGSQTCFPCGDNDHDLWDFAWYYERLHTPSHPVGEKKPNAFNLCDMLGNIYEWCEDMWHDNYENKPEKLKANGRAWIDGDDGGIVVRRGGSRIDEADNLRSAHRDNFTDLWRDEITGFRIATSLRAFDKPA